jgi:hypothetical protein
MRLSLKNGYARQNYMIVLGVSDGTRIIKIEEVHDVRGGREGNLSPAAC